MLCISIAVLNIDRKFEEDDRIRVAAKARDMVVGCGEGCDLGRREWGGENDFKLGL